VVISEELVIRAFSHAIYIGVIETVDLHDHPKTTIEYLSEVVAAQTGENRQLKAENCILWDLLLFDLSEVTMYDGDDSSTLVAGVGALQQNGA
jgi:hypothetical protein